MNTHMIKKKLSAAYRYSYTHLALNFYTYFEAITENGVSLPEFEEYRKELAAVLSCYLMKEECTERTRLLRDKITESMDFVINYSECFQIYEYVFNRMERKFFPQKDNLPEDEELIRQITEFFSAAEDNMVLNDRIKEIIAEVPIRFTKAKFFSLVKEGLAAYVGSPKDTLEEFLGQLQTCTVLQVSDTGRAGYEPLTECLQQLSALDYRKLEKEQFTASLTKIVVAGETLAACVDQLLMAQQLVNDLYILCLSKEDAVIELGEEEAAEMIVGSILRLLEEDADEIPAEVDAKLQFLEGKQEISYEHYTAIAGSDSESFGESEAERRMWMVDRLMTNSPFLSLEPEKPSEQEDIADELWVNGRIDSFCDELSDVFANLPKPVVRALMAKMLSSLPLWFHSVDDIIDYIKDGLTTCLEPAEKESSIELMCKIMEMEYALV